MVNIILLIIIPLIPLGFISFLIFTSRIAKKIYFEKMVRDSKEKFKRECTWTDDPEQVDMWDKGHAFRKRIDKFVTEVDIYNEDLHLFGEYFDFGYKRTVIVVPGRCETLEYSYYFAETYENGKVNILVIDNRCTGKSDGVYFTAGIKESNDILAWMNFLINDKKQEEIYTHNICVGGVSTTTLLDNKKYPKEFKKAVFDGLFITFKETFATHMKDTKHPLFPVFYEIFYYFKKYTKISIDLSNPLKHLKNMDINFPILFIFGKKDIFSLPEKSQILFDNCTSKYKKIKWYDVGHHSHLRINNTESYDRLCQEFLNE